MIGLLKETGLLGDYISDLVIIRLILNESIWRITSKFGRGGRAESGVRVWDSSMQTQYLVPRLGIHFLLPE